MKLNYHLPNQNSITLRDSESLPALLAKEGISMTMLTEWFELNKRDIEAGTLTYTELPQKYVWHEQTKVWKLRKQNKVIGRIIYSNPASGERYYLRMLLNIVRGAESFEKLMTVNDVEYKTFKDACFAYRLLNDDKEWTYAITEPRQWALAPQPRDLFITILLFCDVSKPLQFWEENWEALSEDILHKKRKHFRYPDLELTEEQIKNYCLIEIQDLLNRNGKSLDDFQDLPRPDQRLLTNMDNCLIREALDFGMQKSKVDHDQLYLLLNTKQHLIYDEVIDTAHKQRGRFSLFMGLEGRRRHFSTKL